MHRLHILKEQQGVNISDNYGGDIYFHFNLSLASRSSQFGGAHANKIKHDHSPVVYVVETPSTINHKPIYIYHRNKALRYHRLIGPRKRSSYA